MKKFSVIVFLSLLFCNIVHAQSSLPECDGSPYEVRKFSLTGGSLTTKMKMLAKWRNCFGTLINKDGSKYIGEFQGGKYSGEGILTYDDGAIYEGSFLKGKSNGYGTLKFNNGDSYVGEFKGGKYSGKGISSGKSFCSSSSIFIVFFYLQYIE